MYDTSIIENNDTVVTIFKIIISNVFLFYDKIKTK